MSDPKDLLAQAITALDQERAAAADALQQTRANLAGAQAKVLALTAQVADLQNQLAALDPWAGVDKTGKVDVTATLQKNIDAGLRVPAGRYLIDAVKGLKVTGNVVLDPNAILIAKPNSAPRYCVLELEGDGSKLTGGQIIGDRMSHTYTAGSTHEWGYGFKMTGNACVATGLKVSQCTGDGLGITGDNCRLDHVVSTQNRRQAISVFNADGFAAYDCQFTDTGALTVDGKTDGPAPNGPCAGIDFEPDAPKAGQPAPVVNAHLERCTITGNRAGVLAWLRAEVGGALNITVKDCTIGANANGIHGKALAGAVSFNVVGNRFDHNRSANVRAESGCTAIVGTADAADANTSTGLAQRYALRAVGQPPGVIHAGVNKYL